MPALLLALLLGIFGAIRYGKALVAGKDFEGRVRGIILLNPMMRDDEARERITRAAAEAGVEVDMSRVRVDRGHGAFGGSAISAIQLSYSAPVRWVVVSWTRTSQSEVRP